MEEGDRVAGLVAQHMTLKGYDVYKKPLRITPDREHRFDYSDNGDIDIYWKGQTLNIEVTHLKGYEYTDHHDYPYQLVNVADAYRKYPENTWYWVKVSRDLETLCLINVTTKPKWVKQWGKDSGQNYQDTLWIKVPLELVHFTPLVGGDELRSAKADLL